MPTAVLELPDGRRVVATKFGTGLHEAEQGAVRIYMAGTSDGEWIPIANREFAQAVVLSFYEDGETQKPELIA